MLLRNSGTQLTVIDEVVKLLAQRGFDDLAQALKVGPNEVMKLEGTRVLPQSEADCSLTGDSITHEGTIPMSRDSQGPAASSARRRHFSAVQKAALMKRHLLEGVSASDLYDEPRITPTQSYQWQKQLFEGGATVLYP